MIPLVFQDKMIGLLNLGDPDWRDSFSSAAYWYLLDTDDTLFEVEDGNLVMKALSKNPALPSSQFRSSR